MMESLRNFLTGPRLLIVVLICALPFVFLGTSSLGSAFNASFGTINGEEVSELDVQLASNSTVQRFQSLYGADFEFDLLDDDFKSQSIKQELIIQKVLLAGARSMGFINESTKQEIKKDIIQSPLFQVDGVFSEDIYGAQVNSNGFTKESYIDVMTDFAASELFRTSFNSINFITKNELFELASLLEQSSNINFIKINFEELKSEIVNSSEELLDFYNENPSLFFSDEEKSFKYIILDKSDYEDKVQIPDSYLENSYAQYLLRFEDSAQIRISHIMVEKNNYDSTDQALESIKNIEDLLTSGNDFSSIAAEYSEDIVTKDIGGDLDYFEKDIFPVEFDDAIQSLELNEYSKIIELDDTFHILKVTEKNIQEPLSEDQVKDDLIKELIETESLALMQDDFDESENMILNNNSLEEIASDLSKDISNSQLYTSSNYDFELTESEIKNYLFSPDSLKNVPYAIELSDRVIVLAINEVNEPALQDFDVVEESISDMLSQSKAVEKIVLMTNEINAITDKEEIMSFIGAYNYVAEESFVDVKRYSSLLPREVLNTIFNASGGSRINTEASNGDNYIIDVVGFNYPPESEINEIIEEYNSIGEEIINTKMSQIVNEDVFQSARVNLSNLIF
ncbi:MAG: SurA N-terminal domain-containing protein [Gammaproteobacteria bacterium]